MNRSAVALLASALLTGCEIDFVEVEERPTSHVSVRSEHVAAFEVSLEIALSDRPGHPLARVGSVSMPWEKSLEGWRSQLALAVDTLRPQIELVLREEREQLILLPLLARNGAAVRHPNGDLELPVARGDSAEAWAGSWAVVLVDSSGRPLVRIDWPTAPLPSPLLLQPGLVPREAVAAELSAYFSRQFESQASYPLTSGINSTVHIPIPR